MLQRGVGVQLYIDTGRVKVFNSMLSQNPELLTDCVKRQNRYARSTENNSDWHRKIDN